jgi:hypothetical protein
MKRWAFFAGLLFALFCSPAWADFDRSRVWFDALPEDTRYQLQADLILLGYYNAFTDGEFGPGTYKGLTAYQTREGVSASGILSRELQTRLHSYAEQVFATLGMGAVSDEPSGASFMMPTGLLTVSKATELGTAFSTPDYGLTLETFRLAASAQDFQSLYNEMGADLDGRVVTYRNFNSGRFVLSGREQEATFYVLVLNTGTESIGFTTRFTEDYARQGTLTTSYAASHFIPTSMLDLPPTAETAAPAVTTAPQRVGGWGAPDPAPATPERVGDLTDPEPAPTAAAPAADLQGTWIGGFYLPDDLPETVLLYGEIGSATPLEFLRVLRTRPEVKVLALDSPGGLVDPALVVAHEVKDRGLATLIIEGSGCYSACAFIYFAGTERLAIGELGVHQLWNEANDLVSGQAKLSDVVEALDDFAVDRDILSVMLRTPPSDMHVFTAAEIQRYGLNAGDPLARGRMVEEAAPQVEQGASSDLTFVESTRSPSSRVLSFTTTRTNTVPDILKYQALTPASTTAVAEVFRTAFGLSVVPKGVEVRVEIGPALFGEGDVPRRMTLRGVPETYRNTTGVAQVVLNAAGTYEPGTP